MNIDEDVDDEEKKVKEYELTIKQQAEQIQKLTKKLEFLEDSGDYE